MSPALPPKPAEAPGLLPEFAEAFLHRHHTVLGRRLKPLALWHTFVLKHYRSPFVTGGPASWTDLRAAVEICQFDYGQWELQRLPARGFSRQWTLFRRFLQTRRFDFNAEARKFQCYIKDFQAVPRIYRKRSKDQNDPCIPAELSLASTLIYYTGWVRREAWMLPIGELHHYLPSFALAAGADLRWGTETKEELEERRKAIADYQAMKAKRTMTPAEIRKLRTRKRIKATL